MEFTLSTTEGPDQKFTADARYNIENGVLQVYAEGRKVTYAPGAWKKITESA